MRSDDLPFRDIVRPPRSLPMLKLNFALPSPDDGGSPLSRKRSASPLKNSNERKAHLDTQFLEGSEVKIPRRYTFKLFAQEWIAERDFSDLPLEVQELLLKPLKKVWEDTRSLRELYGMEDDKNSTATNGCVGGVCISFDKERDIELRGAKYACARCHNAKRPCIIMRPHSLELVVLALAPVLRRFHRGPL